MSLEPRFGELMLTFDLTAEGEDSYDIGVLTVEDNVVYSCYGHEASQGWEYWT